MLGHVGLTTTAVYLNVEKVGLHESMRRFGTAAWQSVAESPATERRHDGHEATGTTPHIAVN
jgi:hypothetical protein